MNDTSYFLAGINIKVEFENIGEGKCGDYNENNPNDINYLRFYVSERVNGKWEDIDDASYCTQIPADSIPEIIRKAVKYVYNAVEKAIENGESVKKLCERLSWIEPSWLEKEERNKNEKKNV